MSIERFFAFVESVMERLDQTILSKIFLDVDYLKDLLRISMVCRQWRTIIMEKSFLQKRFLQRRDKYLMYHWKFNDNFNFAWNSNEKMKIDKYYQTGHLQQDICFLGSCLLFDAHSSITIPLHRCLSERFAISLWIQNTSSVHSWRTILDIILFQSRSGVIQLNITPQSKIENQLSINPSRIAMKCRSDKQTIVRYLWYHLVILISADTQQLFLNGRFQREIKQNSRLDLEMKELNIGTDSNGFHCWFGRMADLSLWKRWLDPVEIRGIWQQRVSIDQFDLGEYLIANYQTTQRTTFRSVLL